MTVKALGYSRTSSAANVDGDSEKRQRDAIERYALANGITIDADDWFYDPAVSGVDLIEGRPGFARMLTRLASNGVRTILVEDASRFARDLMTQEIGIRRMQEYGARVITAAGVDLTDDTSPDRVMIRQILGAVAQNEKARLVAKLKAARDRKSAQIGRRIEGRHGHRAKVPDMVFGAITELVSQHPTITLQAIANELTDCGILTSGGKPYSLVQIGRHIRALGLARVDGRKAAAIVLG